MTRVASNTIISSTSGMFTLVLSVIVLKENPNLLKFLSVITVILGVTCIGLSDTQGNESLKGDAFALLGAVVYSVYSVFLKAEAVQLDMSLFFGFVGAINSVILLPVLIFINFTGIEEFEFPDGMVLGFLTLNALFGTVLSDMLWALSVKHLNPALCTVGLSLTIPLSMLVDKILHNYSYSWLYLAGAFLIICGFIIMSLFENASVAEKLNSYKYFVLKRKDMGEGKALLNVNEMSRIITYCVS